MQNECIFSITETIIGKEEYKEYTAFDNKALHRFCLRHTLNSKNNKTITVILMNPSYADENKLDFTLSNVKGFLSEKYPQYSAFEVLNIFSIRMPKSGDLKQLVQKYGNKENCKFIREYLDKNSNDILLAWGNQYHKDALWILNELKNCSNKLFVYGLNKNGSPRHFSPLVFNKIKNKEDLKLCEVKIDGIKLEEKYS